MNLTQHLRNEVLKTESHIPLSGVASYHLLSGSLALQNTVITNGFSTTLYTGNGTTQSINTGIDMATQWGNDVSETFGGLVWGKSRSNAIDNLLIDTVRSNAYYISSNITNAQIDSATLITSFNSNGFTLGANTRLNTNLATYASWNFQTTHRTSGVTNHGKAYTCHYNPFTGFTMVKYEGSGLAGHEIPHHLGRKLGFASFKKLSAVSDWIAQYRGNNYLFLNLTNAEASSTTVATFNDVTSVVGTSSGINDGAGATYIMYGWANSYFDEANTLIGNYYTYVDGNGILCMNVHTSNSQSEVLWKMSKTTLTTGDWDIVDFTRGNTKELNANLSAVESTITANTLVNTASPATYSKATDTSNLNLNAIVPYANGIDANGTKNTILTKNETVSGLTFTEGKNYVYSKNDGTYGVSAYNWSAGTVNPANGGDFFNVLENKWYTSAGAIITESRNYLNAIVYADVGGQPTYVEQLPKTQYFDEVKANEFKGKNACTAWVNFDGTTTPPTIRDSYNVKAVIRTAAGTYDVYFEEPMDSLTYSPVPTNSVTVSADEKVEVVWSVCSTTKMSIANRTSSVYYNSNFFIQVFGGKN